jgi:uncharacterized membrane protein YeiH
MLTLVLSLQSIQVGIFPLFALCGSLQALLEYRRHIKWSTGKSLEQEVSFGQGLFSLIFSALGGSIMTGLLLGQPPGWLNKDGVLLAFILVFILQYVGDGIVIRLCEQMNLIRRALGLMDSLSYGFSITSWGVDLALSSVHWKSSPLGAILCGIVSGLGSQVLQETFHLYDREWRFSTPALLAKPHRWYLSPRIHTAIWTSSIYYIGLHLSLIARDTLKAIIILSVGLYNFRNCLLMRMENVTLETRKLRHESSEDSKLMKKDFLSA